MGDSQGAPLSLWDLLSCCRMTGLIIQANLHHSKAATDLLAFDMQRSRSKVVALVQEPYLGRKVGTSPYP